MFEDDLTISLASIWGRIHRQFRLCAVLDADHAKGGAAAGHRRSAGRQAEEARRRRSLPRRTRRLYRVSARRSASSRISDTFLPNTRKPWACLLSGSIALIVGLIDDFGALTPRQKTLGQILAALVLIKSGTYIKLTFLPWYVSIPLTVLWILAVTNAFNIIDIMDGLASGVATIAALIIAAANFMAGRDSQAFLAVVLAGAAFGFPAAQLSSGAESFSETPAACSSDSCWPRFR